MLPAFEKCESCGYEHGNIFTGECAACRFFSKYTPKEAPTMWDRIKDELNSFAKRHDLIFRFYHEGAYSYYIKFSYKSGKGPRKEYSKSIYLNDVDDWLDFTNKIENEVIDKLDLNRAVALTCRTEDDYRSIYHLDVRSLYPDRLPIKPFIIDTDTVERPSKPSAMFNKIMEDLMNTNKTKITGRILTIEKVIFNKPATIVMWSDGTKTVVKVQGKERFNKEKGLAMAISKKFFGNEGNYYEEFKKWI